MSFPEHNFDDLKKREDVKVPIPGLDLLLQHQMENHVLTNAGDCRMELSCPVATSTSDVNLSRFNHILYLLWGGFSDLLELKRVEAKM